jgi:molybdopterin converting factor small subunit
LLFARFAEAMGRDSLELEPGVARSVGHLLAHLRALPGGELLPPAPLVAINHSQVRGDQPILPGDEVAVLPPLAGG